MKGLKGLLIAGIVIVVLGVGILIWGLATNGWKFGLDWSTEEFTCESAVSNADFGISAGKVKLIFTDDDKASVTYPVSDRYTYEVKEENGTLKISTKQGNFWFLTPSFMYGGIPDLIIRLPKSVVCDIKFSMSAGTAELDGGEYGDMSVEISAGTFKAGYLDCGSFKMNISAGTADILGLNADRTDIKLSAGSADVKRIECDKINVDVSAGDVDLAVLGSEAQYNITVDKSAGSCNLSSRIGADAAKLIDIDVSAGSVDVTFTGD